MKKLVLYADDDADDRTWVEEAFNAINAQLSVHFLENGNEVLSFLQSAAVPPLPSLIILDLNMPQLDGRQTLRHLKSHPVFRQVPVAVVSTSSNQLDREACYFLGAELFLVKPTSYAAWKDIMQELIPLAV